MTPELVADLLAAALRGGAGGDQVQIAATVLATVGQLLDGPALAQLTCDTADTLAHRN